MLLTIDLGNSNITLGVYQDDNLLFVSRLNTDFYKTTDQYAIELKDILELYKISPDDVDGSIISSVVPTVLPAITAAIEALCGVAPIVVGPGVKSGLNIKIDDPAQLGADMVACGVAALQRYTMPCIMYDLGTATTVSVLGAGGSFLGCAILAGMGISLDALATKTAQLPYVKIEAPTSIIGTNSIDSMKSGLVLGTAAMMDAFTQRIEDELGQTATVVATGGLASIVLAHCKRDIIYSDTLLLEGLRIIYDKNTK